MQPEFHYRDKTENVWRPVTHPGGEIPLAAAGFEVVTAARHAEITGNPEPTIDAVAVAAILGRSRWSVYQLRRVNGLPLVATRHESRCRHPRANRDYRITRAALDHWLARHPWAVSTEGLRHRRNVERLKGGK